MSVADPHANPTLTGAVDPAAATVPLRPLGHVRWSPRRVGEPVTLGVPLPKGAVRSGSDVGLERPNGATVPLQSCPLDRWPDGSIRWLLLDFRADADDGRAADYVLRLGAGAARPPADGLRTIDRPSGVEVATGTATFGFFTGGAFPFSSVKVGGAEPIDVRKSGVVIDGADWCVTGVGVRHAGPLRAELEVHAARRDGRRSPLALVARVELFAGSATVRLELTLRNRRRASHPRGKWLLGDAGSVHLRSAALVLTLGEPLEGVQCAAEPGAPMADADLPFELHQESSGGAHWNGPVHRSAAGDVPLRFRGYALHSGVREQAGLRASPVVVARSGAGTIGVALPGFWENFPRTVGASGSSIELGLFPRQSSRPHELQGGEQKTHVVVVAFGRDQVSDPPLAWCHDPLRVYPPPAWCCQTGAVPFLVPETDDPNAAYLELVKAAIEGPDSFVNKRERQDEYGWRHFGDIVADHESAFRPPDAPLVSHYNNQYDALAGFCLHFLRSGDERWWRLLEDLARHVRDIDIYHTVGDKAAYNGGLFWHTVHYLDAGTSTHRTYPAESTGGGPSAEHNYNAGLMLHYFLTGHAASREAAIGLGRWVLDMDDPRQTVFRWLSGAPTGYASFTLDSFGPGRGAGHSILACLSAHRLSGDRVFLDKAEELIRRTIHPDDDVAARDLLDTERRWSYTAFLQALGVYLHLKEERDDLDDMFAYARASLLRYAQWMAIHERPWLDRPAILEFPTETWAAQDMRKAEVFLWASLHASGRERETFVERARFFFDYSVATVGRMPGRHYARPVVLLLSNGIRYGWFLRHPAGPTRVTPPGAFPPPRPFVPQRAIAMRRARWLAAGMAVATLVATAWWLLG